jgi:hypothetical protein
MAIYRIFPSQDTTIYSQYPHMNTGRDEILEISNDLIVDLLEYQISRALIKFSSDDINIAFSLINSSSYDSYLKLFLANASNIPLDYSLECYPLFQTWNMGTGKYGDIPLITNGATWKSTVNSGSIPLWVTSSTDVTSSFSSAKVIPRTPDAFLPIGRVLLSSNRTNFPDFTATKI